MPKQFIYPPTNSIRLVQQNVELDTRYNTLPFDLLSKECYSHKRQYNDTEYMQCLSDWVPVVKIYRADTGETIANINPTTPANGIIDQTFQLYQFEIDWVTITTDCYIELSYTDDNAVLNIWQSAIIQLRTKWANTLLYQYTDSNNKFSTIFSSGLIFNNRIESYIAEYTPEFDDVIYNDQTHNTTLLNAITYRTFTLYVPGKDFGSGVPEWVIDQVNWIFGCDQVQIDGVYYRNNSGAKWEINRAPQDGIESIGAKLQIIEVDNKFLLSLKTGANQPQSFRIVSLAADKQTIAGNTTFTGLFNSFSRINSISIRNRGVSFTIKAGVTSGGNEVLHETTVPTGGDTYLVNYFFNALGVLYFTIPTGSDVDIFIDYTQFDAPTIVPGSVTTVLKGRPRSYACYDYTTPQQFQLDFDAATGLGKGDYAGTALMDGRNGTTDMGLRTPLGYKANASWADLGITAQTGVIPFNAAFGSATTTLLPGNLPPLEAPLPANPGAGGQGGSLNFNAPGGATVEIPIRGAGNDPLTSTPFGNISPVVYTVFYKELTNV